jgi:hypothetical protein
MQLEPRSASRMSLRQRAPKEISTPVAKHKGGRPPGSKDSEKRSAKRTRLALSVGGVARASIEHTLSEGRRNLGDRALTDEQRKLRETVGHAASFIKTAHDFLISATPEDKAAATTWLRDVLGVGKAAVATKDPRVESGVLLARNTEQATRTLKARQEPLNKACRGDFTGQVRYAIQSGQVRIQDLIVEIAPYLKDGAHCLDALGLVVSAPLSYSEALDVKIQAHMSDRDYLVMRALLPAGLLPSLTPVKKSLFHMATDNKPVKDLEDAACAKSMIGMIVKDMGYLGEFAP